MSADLLPCPWCGKTDGLDIYGSLAPHIWCGNCDLHGPPGRSIDTAHAAWNTRAADDSPPPADAELLALANRTLAADLAKVRADRDRLAAWLADIEGGDNPCDDAATLRRWAYEAVTLGREVSDG